MAGSPQSPSARAGADRRQDPREELDRHRLVRIALDRLPERQRLAVVLVYHQGLRDREAAELMGTSVEALESLLARARRMLRRLEPVRSDLLVAP